MHLNEMDHRHPHQETKTNNLVEPFKMMDGFHEGFSMTIYVGRSEQQGNREVNKNSSAGKKETRLPYANMMVSPKIQNLMSSADKRRYNNIAFKTEIRGQTLIVTRTDSNKGWGFELQLKAYYVKKSIGTHYRAFDFDFKNEESAVTLSLCPDQKFRCIPKAIIFKDENVIMTIAEIFDGSTIKRSGIPGRFLKDINKNIRLHNKNTKKKKSLNAIAVAEYAISREENTHGVTANTFAEYTYCGEKNTRGLVVLGGNLRSKILHISLGEYGNKIIFQRGSFLATSDDVQLVQSGSQLDRSYASLVGYGDVFLKTGKAVKKFVLKDRLDSISVVESCVIAFTQDMTSTSEMVDKISGMILKKRVVSRTLIGPGTVWLNHTRVDIVGYDRKSVGVEIGSTMKIIEDTSVALDDMSSGLTVSHHSEASEASYDLLSAQAYDKVENYSYSDQGEDVEEDACSEPSVDGLKGEIDNSVEESDSSQSADAEEDACSEPSVDELEEAIDNSVGESDSSQSVDVKKDACSEPTVNELEEAIDNSVGESDSSQGVDVKEDACSEPTVNELEVAIDNSVEENDSSQNVNVKEDACSEPTVNGLEEVSNSAEEETKNGQRIDLEEDVCSEPSAKGPEEASNDAGEVVSVEDTKPAELVENNENLDMSKIIEFAEETPVTTDATNKSTSKTHLSETETSSKLTVDTSLVPPNELLLKAYTNEMVKLVEERTAAESKVKEHEKARNAAEIEAKVNIDDAKALIAETESKFRAQEERIKFLEAKAKAMLEDTTLKSAKFEENMKLIIEMQAKIVVEKELMKRAEAEAETKVEVKYVEEAALKADEIPETSKEEVKLAKIAHSDSVSMASLVALSDFEDESVDTDVPVNFVMLDGQEETKVAVEKNHKGVEKITKAPTRKPDTANSMDRKPRTQASFNPKPGTLAYFRLYRTSKRQQEEGKKRRIQAKRNTGQHSTCTDDSKSMWSKSSIASAAQLRLYMQSKQKQQEGKQRRNMIEEIAKGHRKL